MLGKLSSLDFLLAHSDINPIWFTLGSNHICNTSTALLLPTYREKELLAMHLWVLLLGGLFFLYPRKMVKHTVNETQRAPSVCQAIPLLSYNNVFMLHMDPEQHQNRQNAGEYLNLLNIATSTEDIRQRKRYTMLNGTSLSPHM